MRLWCQRSIRLILSRRFQQSAKLHGTSSAWALHNFYGSLYLFRHDEGDWMKEGGGYPTGVGCLLARKAALAKLRLPWYAGGAITLSSIIAANMRERKEEGEVKIGRATCRERV